MGVLDTQSLRENLANRKLGRRRLKQRSRARQAGEDTAERRRPDRGSRRPVGQDETADFRGRRRRQAQARLGRGLDGAVRALLIALLFPIQLAVVLLQPRDFVRRLRDAPARMRSGARRLRMASKDPKSGPGRLWGTARLSAHFIQEEFADMQDGFPRPAEIASGLLDALHAGAERVGKRLGLLPEGSHDDVGERLFHAAALGLIAGTIVVGLFISTFAGVEALKSSERLALVELTVHGLERTGRADLDRALEIAVGDNLLEFEPEVVALRGTELPWVDELQIERNLRTQVLKVRVVEHRPALLLASGDGMHLVDDKGAVFKPLEQGDPSDFPVLILEGSADPAVLSEASSGALEVLHALAAGRSVSRSDVSELRFDPADGFLLVTRRGLPIRLGRRDLADRLGRLERAVEVGDLPLDALASVDIGLRDRLVAVPLSTRTARKRIEDRVKKQPVQTSERRRMLHLDRIRQSLGDAGEAEL